MRSFAHTAAPGSPRRDWRPLAVKLTVAALLYHRARRPARPPHRLRPGDRLHLRLYPTRPGGERLRVQPDGTLFTPGAGHLVAAGKTVEQVRAMLNYGLDGETGRLRVRLRLVETGAAGPEAADSPAGVVADQAAPREPAVILSGAAARPVRLPWRPGLTLSQALTRAGGLTPAADPNQVTLYSHAGELRTIDRSRARGAAVRLHPGDYVVVPER